MTLDDIQSRLDYISKIKGDYEAAHSEEDDLMRDFIASVVLDGSVALSAKAEMVLKSADIEFVRYTA